MRSDLERNSDSDALAATGRVKNRKCSNCPTLFDFYLILRSLYIF